MKRPRRHPPVVPGPQALRTVVPMCGIVGVLDPRRRVRAEDWEGLLDAMSAPMVPRGPDGSGTWAGPTTGSAWASAASA